MNKFIFFAVLTAGFVAYAGESELSHCLSKCFSSLSLEDDGSLCVEMVKWGAHFAGGVHKIGDDLEERELHPGERLTVPVGYMLEGYRGGPSFNVEFSETNLISSSSSVFVESDSPLRFIRVRINREFHCLIVPDLHLSFDAETGSKTNFKLPFANIWKSYGHCKLNVEMVSRCRAAEISRSRAYAVLQSARQKLAVENREAEDVLREVYWKEIDERNARGGKERWLVELEVNKGCVRIRGLAKCNFEFKSASVYHVGENGKIDKQLLMRVLGKQKWYGTIWKFGADGKPNEFAEWREGGKIVECNNGMWHERVSDILLGDYFKSATDDIKELTCRVFQRHGTPQP